MKKALMKGIKETLAGASELRFHSDNTEIKSAFFRFLMMTVMEMIHQEFLDSILT